ncbi:MAG: class I mannose-6-phosphate isomerase [Acidobacteriia bacterium]|nr:class I mannose-6-phosphate isomerase [Terriglobia bacterium]
MTSIEPQFVERVWGATDLSPLYLKPDRRIGEVWFPAGDLLIKFLFTTAALSVQVHPDDDYARRHENSRGKTEMWYILRADAGARIALGFREKVDREVARGAAEDGTIEQLLDWYEPAAGDTFFTAAGTVHALGAGLVVCEIQQSSDVTYRLYDYGRGRPLQLDRGMEVADLGPHTGRSKPVPMADGGLLLARCEYFVTELRKWSEPGACAPGYLIVLEGSGQIGKQACRAGEVWRLDSPVLLKPDGAVTWLRTYVPDVHE